MSYDLERYREKREKVLGIKRRGPSFGQLVATFAALIFIATGVLVIPQAIAFFQNRNLDDAIFKPGVGVEWTETQNETVKGVSGVVHVSSDQINGRVVVTFNRTMVDAGRISTALAKNGLSVVLLNVVGHSERLRINQKEQAFESL